jgi:hypothetical protein
LIGFTPALDNQFPSLSLAGEALDEVFCGRTAFLENGVRRLWSPISCSPLIGAAKPVASQIPIWTMWGEGWAEWRASSRRGIKILNSDLAVVDTGCTPRPWMILHSVVERTGPSARALTPLHGEHRMHRNLSNNRRMPPIERLHPPIPGAHRRQLARQKANSQKHDEESAWTHNSPSHTPPLIGATTFSRKTRDASSTAADPAHYHGGRVHAQGRLGAPTQPWNYPVFELENLCLPSSHLH